MKCRDIERMIIHSSEQEFSPEELKSLEKHLSECDRCGHLQADLKDIQSGVQRWKGPSPSNELDQQTCLMCHEILRAEQEAESCSVKQSLVPKISRPAWVVLVSLIVLTTIWISPLLKECDLSLPLTPETTTVLAIMIQNGILLCFAPLLIRRCRLKQLQFKIIRPY